MKVIRRILQVFLQNKNNSYNGVINHRSFSNLTPEKDIDLTLKGGKVVTKTSLPS